MIKKQRLENTKQIIKYEQIIAGALLKFQTLDSVDISILLEDFMSLTEVKIDAYCYIKNLEGYINCYRKDGSISLYDKTPLDSFIEAENCTVREKYLKVAGKFVIDYFEQIDVEEFKQRKQKLLEEQKINLLKDANILLISDNEEDYNELKKYGFQNIDYFRSIVRADKYFSKHPKQLEKYHIILKGHQSVQRSCIQSDVKLDYTLVELRNAGKVIFTTLYSYSYLESCIGFLRDFKNGRSWEIKEDSYSKALDRIVENSLINHILELVNLKGKKITPIEDYINPNRLPLPTKKSNLKILYLGSMRINKHAKEIANKLGLNITFKEDNNFSLEKYIQSHLGEYDIIIVSSLFSESILYMNNESTEQYKDTGRELTLFVTYKNNSISQFDEDMIHDSQGIGDKIELQYIFGGNYSISQEIQKKEFRVLRQPCETPNPGYGEKYAQSEITNMQSIIEEAVHLYNEALLRNQESTLSDFDLKTSEEYDEEYDAVDKKEKERKKQALAPIDAFDNLTIRIMYYLRNKSQGLIEENLEGLNIKETPYGICVENIHQGRMLCSITFSRKYKHENLRVFSIQTLTKKGKLGNPELVGLYTRKYENLAGVPKRPTEVQMNALLATEKKVEMLIAPLNTKILNKSYNKDKTKKRSLGTRRNNTSLN